LHNEKTVKNYAGTELPDWFWDKMPNRQIKVENVLNGYSQYSSDDQLMYFDRLSWGTDNQTEYTRKAIFSHECGHYYHHLSDLITYKEGAEVSEKIKQAFNKSRKIIQEQYPEWWVQHSEFNIKQIARRAKNPKDRAYQIAVITDIVQALSPDFKLGFGHEIEYYKSHINKKYAEVYAHAFQTALIGNDFMKKNLPLLYDNLLNLMDYDR